MWGLIITGVLVCVAALVTGAYALGILGFVLVVFGLVSKFDTVK